MLDFFIGVYRDATALDMALESVVFVFGIASVWYAKQENILVYPTGLIATSITVYLLYQAGYLGDMTMNVYYSIISLYGWWRWSRGSSQSVQPLQITTTDRAEKLVGLLLCLLTMLVTWLVYRLFGRQIEWLNWVDILTSGLFFTAMWYMANKKLENWVLWITADVITVPLYAWRGLGMLAAQYLVFTVLAVLGYLQWRAALTASARNPGPTETDQSKLLS